MESSLEWIPTATLVRELMSRDSFGGLLIYSPREARAREIHSEFQLVLSPRLGEDLARRLLAGSMDMLCPENHTGGAT